MAGVPMLPLAGCATSATVNKAPKNSALAPLTKAVKQVKFIGMEAPSLANPEQMATVYVNSKMQADFTDGSKQVYDLDYTPFFITGDMVPNGLGGTTRAGQLYDINNKPLYDASAGEPVPFFSNCPDGTSLLTVKGANVAGVKGNTVFAVVQFEYASMNRAGKETWGRLPSPIAVLTLDQNPSTGELKLVKYHNVDTSPVHGLWITCGASLSPWGTHLSSEEYEPDTHNLAKEDDGKFLDFSKALYGDQNKANPYHYGHLPEVFVNPDGTGFVKKHYNLGRISHELIQVMPDERTALMGDDTTNGGLFMFVADKPRDLSAGNLYVAKVNQTTPKGVGTGEFVTQWIHLGHATSSEVEAMANTFKPDDIMSVKYEDPKDTSYTKIYYNGKANWVKLNTNNQYAEKAAAFLETHRYAALKGASMAFTKMEGTTVNAKDKVAYSAMSRIEKSMVDPEKYGDYGLKVAQNKSGAVYAHKLSGGQAAINNNTAINSEWVPVSMSVPPNLAGQDIDSDNLGNKSHPDKISCPDNLKYSEKMRTLFIGEDSGTHVNNFLWAYNVDTHELARILSTPAGAESTGLHAVDEVNGFTYIMSNFQHPGEGIAENAKVAGIILPLIKRNYKDTYGAAVGYLGLKI
ncbi:alkaline phosphatase PhoX [Psychrobacter sp.]|uniref:PhoX family protein n=1 Tax=Psychrobacter sp. TaxID=56811 RepID=UPI0025DF3344|nr:alkaline phosphatase PhoX [Psychrobacter sp.]